MAKAAKKAAAPKAAKATAPVDTTGERGRTIKPQFSPVDIWPVGDKMKLLAGMEMQETKMFGTLVGVGRDLSFRYNPQDETKPSVAIVGGFKFIPSDPARGEIWATRAFLPNAVHDTIVASMLGENEAPIKKSPGRKDPAINLGLDAVMEIVLELGIKRNESATGYVYVVEGSNKVPLALADPLAALTAKAGLKALPAPK